MANTDALVCAKCTGDKFVREWIQASDAAGLCSYCGGSGAVIPTSKLANRLEEVRDVHFEVDGWNHDGEPLESVFQAIAGLDERVAHDALLLLREARELVPGKHGKDPYDPKLKYRPAAPDAMIEGHTWRSFCDSLTQRARYFSADIERVLQALFGNIYGTRTREDESVVRTFYPDERVSPIYRARYASDNAELRNILMNPVMELGPPPAARARPGRMNPHGISVFYGATSPDTSLAEIRAPVGSTVVIGRFDVLRPVKLLDLMLLKEAISEATSYFDPRFLDQTRRIAFLQTLASEIARPVMPKDEAFDYLPTQIVAAYLGERVKPQLDGIIYPSSQQGSSHSNIVLFNHASGVQEPQFRHKNTSNMFDGPSIWIDMEPAPPSVPDEIGLLFRDGPPPLVPTLRFVPASLIVRKVVSVNYEYERRDILFQGNNIS